MQTSQAKPSDFFDGCEEFSCCVATDIEGALIGLGEGYDLRAVSDGCVRSGMGVLVGVGRAGSLVTPHSSQTARFDALLKPQIAQTQFDPAASEGVESAADAVTLQSLPVEALD